MISPDQAGMSLSRKEMDDLRTERKEYDFYNNLVVAETEAHTIILTSQRDIEIRILRTCLFFWPAAGSG